VTLKQPTQTADSKSTPIQPEVQYVDPQALESVWDSTFQHLVLFRLISDSSKLTWRIQRLDLFGGRKRDELADKPNSCILIIRGERQSNLFSAITDYTYTTGTTCIDYLAISASPIQGHFYIKVSPKRPENKTRAYDSQLNL
jgi:hypothetical protein